MFRIESIWVSLDSGDGFDATDQEDEEACDLEG